MPRKINTELPQYVYAKPNGKLFFKHPKSGKLPLPPRDAADFMVEYQKLMAQAANGALQRAAVPHAKHMAFAGDASVGALAVGFFRSQEFVRLDRVTKRDMRKRIERALQTTHPSADDNGRRAAFADWRIDEVTKDVARDLRDALPLDGVKLRDAENSDSWRDQHVKAMRAMFSWGETRPYSWREDGRKRTMLGNAFAGLDKLHSEGSHRAWSDDVCDTFEAFCIGEKLHDLRLSYGLMRYGGVRRSDVALLGRANVVWAINRAKQKVRALAFKEWKGSRSRTKWRTNKQRVIPIPAPLLALIETTPGAMQRELFVVNGSGKSKSLGAMSDEDIGHYINNYGSYFNRMCRKAGLPEGCTMHGIRHYLGNRIAENGGTDHQIAAMLGHSGTQSAKTYTKGVRQQRLTEDALDLVA